MLDKPTTGALHESLRLFLLCKMMKWTHLPVAGGLYDQDPKLLDDFHKIMVAESEAEKRKTNKTMGGSKAPSTLGRRRPTRR